MPWVKALISQASRNDSLDRTRVVQSACIKLQWALGMQLHKGAVSEVNTESMLVQVRLLSDASYHRDGALQNCLHLLYADSSLAQL